MSPSSGPLILVLDLGSSSVRCAAFSGSGRRVPGSLCRLPAQPRHGPGGGEEQDPDRVVHKAVQVAQGTLRALGPEAGLVRAAAVSCHWHSLLGVDRRGRPVTPALLWSDRRSGRQAASLRERFDPEVYHARTGCALHPCYWPSKLLWLRERSPGVFGRVRRWVSLDGYLLGKLQGEYGSGHAMAAGTGLYDQARGWWDEALLEGLDIPLERLPALRPFTAARTGLRKAYRPLLAGLARVPVYPALPDGYCAQLGSGCLNDGEPALTLGTSGALRVLVSGPRPPRVPEGLWSYRVEPERFLVGGAVNNAGNLFSWLRRTLALPTPRSGKGNAACLAELAARGRPAGGRGLAALPFVHGERSPGWPLDARGVLAGLEASTRPEEIYQAFFEAVGFRFAEIHGLLDAAGLVHGEEIRVSGGLREPFLLSAFAHVVDRPLRILPEREASSLGAAVRVLRELGASPAPVDRPAPGRAPGQCFRPAAVHRPAYLAEAARHESLYRLLRGGDLLGFPG